MQRAWLARGLCCLTKKIPWPCVTDHVARAFIFILLLAHEHSTSVFLFLKPQRHLRSHSRSVKPCDGRQTEECCPVANTTSSTHSTRSFGSEMPVRTVSQKFSQPQSGEIFKELWSRPTTTADFGSSLWQIPYSNNICLLEDKIQNWGMYLFTISNGSFAMGLTKWRWLNQRMISNLRVL